MVFNFKNLVIDGSLILPAYTKCNKRSWEKDCLVTQYKSLFLIPSRGKLEVSYWYMTTVISFRLQGHFSVQIYRARSWSISTEPVIGLFIYPRPVIRLFIYPRPVIRLFIYPGPAIGLFIYPGPVISLLIYPGPVIRLFIYPGPVIGLYLPAQSLVSSLLQSSNQTTGRQ